MFKYHNKMCEAYCTTEKKPLYQCIEKSTRHVVHLINIVPTRVHCKAQND